MCIRDRSRAAFWSSPISANPATPCSSTSRSTSPSSRRTSRSGASCALTSGNPEPADPQGRRPPGTRRAHMRELVGDRSPKYNRILLKLSGEALGGARDYGIDLQVVQTIANQVKRVHEMGVQIALVVGGGNIFRGLAASELGFDRATGDYMGMLATVINALALQDALERIGIPARTMTAIQMPQVAEPYIRRRAVRHLEKGRVVILAAGTGNPYLTTDTTAALRAVEIEADVILKATKVDGVYTADPKLDPAAVKFEQLGYLEVLNRGIEVMDNTALTLCMDNDVPIVVFNLLVPGNIERVVMGEEIGTLVSGGAPSG